MCDIYCENICELLVYDNNVRIYVMERKNKKIEFSVDLPSVALGKGLFAECHNHSTRQNWAQLGKTGSGPRFAECYGHGTRRNWALCRVLEPWHSAKIF